MKKSLFIAALAALGALCAGAWQTQKVEVKTKQRNIRINANPIQVVLNGSRVAFPDEGPRLVDDRVYVPLRGVFEGMNASVDWIPNLEQVIVAHADKKIELYIGRSTAIINGEEKVTFDAPPILRQGRTLVPLRFISETLGAQVHWEGASHVVRINHTQP